MELEIIKEKENPLFKRKEIQVRLNTDATPSKVSVTESIAKKFSTNAENVHIKGIRGTFGTQEFIVVANIYNSKEEKTNTEKKKKKGAQTEAPAQEATESAQTQEKAEAQEQELAKPDEEPVSSEQKPIEENKVEEKAE